MGAGVVGVDEIVGAELGDGAGEAEGFDAPAVFAGGGVEGRGLTGEEGGFDAVGGESFDEAEHLPLAAAHFAPRV